MDSEKADNSVVDGLPVATVNQVSFPFPTTSTLRRWTFKVAIFALVVYLAYVVREIWLPLILALILAMVLSPTIDRMEARGWRRSTATLFVFISFLTIVVGLAILATPFLIAEGQEIQAHFERYFPDLSKAGLVKSFHAMNAPDAVAEYGARAIQFVNESLRKSTSPLVDIGMRFASNLIWVVIIPVVTYYVIRDYHIIITKALLIAPSRHRPTVQTAITEITTIFGKYLRGLGIVSLANGVATWLVLELIHVPSALMLGCIAGLLYSVPYVGAVLTVILTAIISFLGGGFNLMVLSVAFSTVLHQIVFDQIITPRVLGGHVGLHPILSIIALLVGNLLLGIVGMLLAVPVAACIQIAVLTMIPKLAVEIELPPAAPGTVSEEVRNEEALEQVEEIDASERRKEAVAQVVDVIEETLSAETETRAVVEEVGLPSKISDESEN
ncbi:MAG TPA: AI-2E family transporter [Fimbriimonadaceae bacterium]|nr:AI-2E family transporter [Fimbriimonadaceae bacterium]